MSDLPETVFIIEKLNEEFDVLQNEMSEMKTKLENKLKKFMEKTLIKFIIYNDEFIDDGYQIDIDDRELWNQVIQDMNDNDWNEDNCMNELYIMDLEWTTPEMWVCNRMRYCMECDAKPDDVEMVLYCREYLCIHCKAEKDGQGQNRDRVATLSDTESESEEEVVEYFGGIRIG
tara:strand:+ start:1260 stop:1781 length:522 start_codon:yes stop_codon:yes gene_type:complete